MSGFITSGDTPEAPLGYASQGYQEQTPENLGSAFEAESVFGGGGPVGALARFGARMYETAAGRSMEAVTGQPQKLSSDEINNQYSPIGPDGKKIKITDEPMYAGVGELIGNAKAQELDRENVISRYANNHNTLTNFGVGAAAFMTDPVNLAASIVPGVGEEAVLSKLGAAGYTGIAARTAARAVEGATGATVGVLPSVALQYGLGNQEASDYDLRSAFKDLAFGAAGGAIIHAGLGAVGDAWKARGSVLPEKAGTPSPEASQILNADATTKDAAMRSSVAQVVSGREVSVDPLFPKPDEAQPTISDLAQRQQEIYREGYEPGMTPDGLRAATDEILPKEETPKEPSRLPPEKVDLYKNTIATEAERLGFNLTDEELEKAAKAMAESHNPEEAPTKPKTSEEVKAGAKPEKNVFETPVAKAPVEVAPRATPPETFPALPKELTKGSPRYKSAEISFDSDVDKALYIVRERSAGKSKAHDKYMDYLKNTVGLSDKEIREGSETVKKQIQQLEKSGEEKITVPKTFSKESKVEIPKEKRALAPMKGPMNAIQLATSLGGIRELRAMDAHKHFGYGGRLVRKTGMSIDDFGEVLADRGYVKERPTTSEVLEIIRDGLSGKHIYAEADRAHFEELGEKRQQEAYHDDLDRHAGELGIDTTGMKTEEIEAELKKQSKIAAEEHNFLDELDDEAEVMRRPYLPEDQNAAKTIPLSAYEGHADEVPEGNERSELETGNEAGSERTEPVDNGIPDGRTAGTDEGGQSVIPGAERISDKELAERQMEGGAKAKVPQKEANEGLFDVAGRGQLDLIADMESKIDMTKLTDEERGLIADAYKEHEIAENNYQQKLKELAGCLAENGA